MRGKAGGPPAAEIRRGRFVDWLSLPALIGLRRSALAGLSVIFHPSLKAGKKMLGRNSLILHRNS